LKKTRIGLLTALGVAMLFVAACKLATVSLALFDVTGAKTAVNPGDTVNFGTAKTSPPQPQTRTFRIENTGAADYRLPFSGGRVFISGADASHFNIPTQPPQSIPPGGSANFDIVFSATTLGSNFTRNAVIGISSIDTHDGSISFNVTGTDQFS